MVKQISSIAAKKNGVAASKTIAKNGRASV